MTQTRFFRLLGLGLARVLFAERLHWCLLWSGCMRDSARPGETERVKTAKGREKCPEMGGSQSAAVAAELESSKKRTGG